VKAAKLRWRFARVGVCLARPLSLSGCMPVRRPSALFATEGAHRVREVHRPGHAARVDAVRRGGAVEVARRRR